MQNTTSQRYIYLDNAATVRPFDSVNLAYNDAEQYSWYNSSALYTPSIEILDKIEKTREFVANNLGVLSSEIFFVSGATEANNWIAQRAVKNKNGNIVYSCVEHPSVINAIKSTTCSCVQVDITKDGDLDWEDFLSKLNSQTSLVSIAHVCGNTGTVNDIHKVVQMVKKTSPKAVVHSDGVQAWCKWDYSLRDLGVDAYTVSAHKIGGKKGLGILYAKKSLSLTPLLYGGKHESGKRAGTLNNANILSLVNAINEYKKLDISHYFNLQQLAISKLSKLDVKIIKGSLPHIFMVCFGGKRAEILQRVFCDNGVIVGTGSACSSKDKTNSVLQSRGLEEYYLNGAIRISLGPHNSLQDLEQACDIMLKVVDNV